MAGKGKAGKLASKGKAKRNTAKSGSKAHFKLSANAIRRLARKGGVKRISSNSYGGVREFVDEFLHRVVSDSTVYAEAAKRVTVTAMDVVYALKKSGRAIYGYGG